MPPNEFIQLLKGLEIPMRIWNFSLVSRLLAFSGQLIPGLPASWVAATNGMASSLNAKKTRSKEHSELHASLSILNSGFLLKLETLSWQRALSELLSPLTININTSKHCRSPSSRIRYKFLKNTERVL